jgi:hypothetical protein
VQKAKKLPHGAEFKDTLQVGQFKDLRDIFRRIHELKHDCAGTSRLPQAQQYSQAARIDVLNPRQINHQHSSVSLTEYGVTQYRNGIASHNSAMASENTYVSQFLNGYLQHHHLLPTFPEIFSSERHPASSPKLAATYTTNDEQSDRQVLHLLFEGYVHHF